MGRTEGTDEGRSRGTIQRTATTTTLSTEKPAAAGGEAEPPSQQIDATERLRMELARLRAKFGADPVIERSPFDEAWMSPTAVMEEDEAEFIDAVADCLGVGLSLDAALSCWDSGGLVYDDAEAEGDGEESGEESDDSPSVPAVVAHAHVHVHVTGRRLLIP